jgi:hypothetical protein
VEQSILKSIKKILGISDDYTAFDLDIIMFINSAFGNLHQLGVGPAAGFSVSGNEEVWNSLGLATPQLNMVKTFIYLKARLQFDPPTTSYLIEALNKQLDEHTWRISTNREWDLDPNDPLVSMLNNEGEVDP